jgi:hypothetical protein
MDVYLLLPWSRHKLQFHWIRIELSKLLKQVLTADTGSLSSSSSLSRKQSLLLSDYSGLVDTWHLTHSLQNVAVTHWKYRAAKQYKISEFWLLLPSLDIQLLLYTVVCRQEQPYVRPHIGYTHMILYYLLWYYPISIDMTVLFPLKSAFNFALMPYDNKYFLLLDCSQSNDDVWYMSHGYWSVLAMPCLQIILVDLASVGKRPSRIEFL